MQDNQVKKIETSKQTIEDYERKVKKILDKRHQIFMSYKAIKKQQRYFNEKHEQDANKRDSVQQLHSSPRKMIKKQVDIIVRGDNQNGKQQDRSDFKKAVQSQASLKDRNKRMLGGIFSHLQKAKSRIQMDEEKIKMKAQMEQKVKNKEKSQNELLKEQKRKGLQDQQSLVLKEKSENAKQLLQYETLILQSKYQNYVNQLSSYIMTKTEPHIFWKPAKDSDLHKKIIQDSQKRITAHKAQIVDKIVSYKQVFQLKSYLSENQKDYYKKMLDRYYFNKSHYLRTKTEPHIFWKPAKVNQKLKIQIQKSSNSINEQCSKLKEALVNSYEKKESEHSDSEQNHFLRQGDSH